MTIEIELWQFLLTHIVFGGAAIMFAVLLSRETSWSMHWQGRALEAEARLELLGATGRTQDSENEDGAA